MSFMIAVEVEGIHDTSDHQVGYARLGSRHHGKTALRMLVKLSGSASERIGRTTTTPRSVNSWTCRQSPERSMDWPAVNSET